VRLHYSAEATALESAGGIARALPFFADEPFLVINGDIWCDWDPAQASGIVAAWPSDRLAHLVLVDNPAHHPEGDFVLRASGLLTPRTHATAPALTFAGIGLYRPALFAATAPDQPAPVAPLLRQAMAAGAVTGERHTGRWIDVGTPARLAALDAELNARQTP